MILLTCPHCGSKFRVKDDLAGRTGPCPTCKKPLPIRRPSAAGGAIPTGKIDGMPSRLPQAGLDINVTLDTPSSASGQQQSVVERLAGHARRQSPYTVESEIARGGMGAVVRATDADIRREVAIKYMLDESDQGKKARFIEEAQITGQLEHPNIVPIHELGIDGQRRLFFAMKMVRGRSVAQILKELQEQADTAEKTWSLGRLLNIFVGVCHALAYAHSREVIHRDLKPANIMVGDFGEVYVMDWGLAKVLGAPEADEQPPAETPPAPALPAALSSTNSSTTDDSHGATCTGTTRIVTSRDADSDLTADGAIMGTPSYMSPEQAGGKSHLLDGRSDIYSLGAILYELLTLHSPIKKDGGHMAVLIRVATGEIERPEKRAPERARAGKIPKELAAVAMKALALKPEDRYPTVESLRRDIERFQEGRSVTAKHDSTYESLVKFVKRNKGFSAATAVGSTALTVVLIVSTVVNYRARVRAEDNYNQYVEEQQARRNQAKTSVPAFVEAARLAVSRKDFDGTQGQLDVALDFDPDYAKGQLLKAQLLVGKRHLAEARQMLAKYVENKPDDAAAARLLELCSAQSPEEPAILGSISDELFRQGVPTLAEELISDKKQMAEYYRKRIEEAFPGASLTKMQKFTVADNGALSLNLANRREVRDLRSLRGIPLSQLYLSGTSVADLSPLKDMPLTVLNVGGCSEVRDLSALAGKKLTFLNLALCRQVSDLRPLKGMPLEFLDLTKAAALHDLSSLEGMPLKTLHLKDCARVESIAVLSGMPLTVLSLSGTKVQDYSPLKNLPLTELYAYGPAFNDLTLALLKGMPLKTLDIYRCPISDLALLQGHKLTRLNISLCEQIDDLSPLAKLPLKYLNIIGCTRANDLSGLRGMQLETIAFTPNLITTGIDALREMKSLKSIGYLQFLPPDEFWTRYDAGEFRK